MVIVWTIGKFNEPIITNGRAQKVAHKCGLVPLGTQLNYRHDNINRVVLFSQALCPTNSIKFYNLAAFLSFIRDTVQSHIFIPLHSRGCIWVVRTQITMMILFLRPKWFYLVLDIGVCFKMSKLYASRLYVGLQPSIIPSHPVECTNRRMKHLFH